MRSAREIKTSLIISEYDGFEAVFVAVRGPIVLSVLSSVALTCVYCAGAVLAVVVVVLEVEKGVMVLNRKRKRAKRNYYCKFNITRLFPLARTRDPFFHVRAHWSIY